MYVRQKQIIILYIQYIVIIFLYFIVIYIYKYIRELVVSM